MVSRITRWRERRLERRRRAAAAVFTRLDRLEAEEVERARIAIEEGEEAAEARFPSLSPRQEADLVASLVSVSEMDASRFLRVVDAWVEQRTQGFNEDERAHRAFGAIQLRMLTSVSNLFWNETRPGVPTFRPELAAEGRRRGWRR